MHLPRAIAIAGWVTFTSSSLVFAQTATPRTSAVSLIIRTDDIGMSHSVNMAMQKLVSTGMPVSVSVLFVCPWYQEAVEILKQHPTVAVGIHLALNSERKNYLWGRVTGLVTVQSFSDVNDVLAPSSDALPQPNPSF